MKNDKKKIVLIILLGACLAGTLVWGVWQDRVRNNTDIAVNQLVFSEICVKNDTILPANDGGYHDYVELYNGGKDVNLKGWYLSDGQSKAIRLEISPFLPAAIACCFWERRSPAFL